MNHKILVCFFLLIVIVTAAGSGCISESDNMPEEEIENIEDIEGLWMGSLEVQGGQELRILFNISTGPEGSPTATMDSLDQGVSGIPVEKLTYKDGNLRLEVTSTGVFEGVLKEDGTALEGEWKQSGLVLPLVLTRIEEKPEMSREQDPVKPYPYDEEEVVYENKEAGIQLAGTLTTPKTEGPFPAVLLITGSGKQDRNEEVFGHRPFLVLSDYLTRQGIAVLRVDDRGVGGSTGNFSNVTTEDFAEDVVAGVEYLKSREDIDPDRIGLVGHSEGGLVAPMAAVRSPDVAFIVLMAGPGVTGEEIVLAQSRLVAEADGVPEETITKNEALLKDIFTVIKEEENDTIAGEEIHGLITDMVENLSEEEKQYSSYTEESLDTEIKLLVSPWTRYFLTYDPKTTLMEVECPVLAINGEKDLQVPPEENLAAIEEALEAGGNEDYTVKELPGLNHLFQTAETGSPSEYAAIEETMSPAAMELIGDWILERTRMEE
ncbi:hypothetical protein MSMTP_1742 [Methanosarcina sp. MTP4]|uniref:alpha/beta hydrolase family protein n=1 Tax=Methanosarcina sp. MTP4 TaxID=1434100 RepID=UPI000615DAE9|nr:alpha/beta fold hydrolase [Methanosarcina sp. MTP4]AKB25211.1 hypothetical protein MSMTP_1742 [Methanosarcina sp. MTP4]